MVEAYKASWIEILLLRLEIPNAMSKSLRLRGIEIFALFEISLVRIVEAYAASWIEIQDCFRPAPVEKSKPLRLRGLKFHIRPLKSLFQR